MKFCWTVTVGTLFVHIAFAYKYGVDPAMEIDLTKALSFNIDELQSVTPVPGFHSNTPAFLFDGSSRMVMLDDSYMTKLIHMTSTSSEFTMMATFLQDRRNSGSLISISSGHNRYMDLFASTRNGEIKFFYTHDGEVRSEIFNMDLAVNEWHQVAVTVSGHEVTLHVDCETAVSIRIMQPDLTFSKRDLSIWVGQRGPTKTLFKGILQDVKIISGSHGFVAQCPGANRECPTCGEYLGMVKLMSHMQLKVLLMENKLSRALHRLDELDKCECMRDCMYNGEMKNAGEKWMEGCTSCSCTNGEASCFPVVCEPIYCNNPVYQEDLCCPSCLRNCTDGGQIYHHGDTYQKKSSQVCSEYLCNDGSKTLVTQNLVSYFCETPTCPTSEMYSVPGSCCQYCQGHDFCNAQTMCEAPKICISLSSSHECVCPGGYNTVDGTCSDVNECAETAAHRCEEGSVCVNLPGSYRCDCFPGHRRINDYQCSQVDECSEEEHNCSIYAACVDTLHGHYCSCNGGFVGDGLNCIPSCTPACQNGGHCTATDECTCPRGYKGKQCQNDVDECEREIHDCTGNSHCVNLVGSHYCECNLGFQRFGSVTDSGDSCEDIDECSETSTCHKTRICNNLVGSYECRCSPSGDCNPHCWLTKKKSKIHDTEWNGDNCDRCTCRFGVLSCTPKPCDCSDSAVILSCCPMCAIIDQCMHQSSGVIFENREVWEYNCQNCQCMDGLVQCTPMDCLVPNCRETYLPIGECCPQCVQHPSCGAAIHTADSVVSSSDGCSANGMSHSNNERWLLEGDSCTECVCVDGNICCRYNELCSPPIL